MIGEAKNPNNAHPHLPQAQQQPPIDECVCGGGGGGGGGEGAGEEGLQTDKCLPGLNW